MSLHRPFISQPRQKQPIRSPSAIAHPMHGETIPCPFFPQERISEPVKGFNRWIVPALVATVIAAPCSWCTVCKTGRTGTRQADRGKPKEAPPPEKLVSPPTSRRRARPGFAHDPGSPRSHVVQRPDGQRGAPAARQGGDLGPRLRVQAPADQDRRHPRQGTPPGSLPLLQGREPDRQAADVRARSSSW